MQPRQVKSIKFLGMVVHSAPLGLCSESGSVREYRCCRQSRFAANSIMYLHHLTLGSRFVTGFPVSQVVLWHDYPLPTF